MKKAYIIAAVIIIIIFGLIAVSRNKGETDSSKDSSKGKIDTSNIDAGSKDLNSLGDSVDSLNDDVELDSSSGSSSTSETDKLSTSNLDSINDEINSLDSSIGGINDNTDL